MTTQSLKKRVPRAIARHGLFSSAWLFNWLPRPLARFLSYVFVAIAFQFTIRQKRVAKESLEIAFGDEKSADEIKKIIHRCFHYVGRGMIELFYYMAHPKATKKNVHINGLQHLDEALKKRNGVIAVTAHFGNFPLMMLRFSQNGYKTGSIIRPARDKKIEEYLLRRRTESGLNTVYAVPRKTCVLQSLESLRNNEILFIPLDQNFGNGSGVFVDFFGQKAATATGPLVLSRRTGAPILPMFITRNNDDTHTVTIEPPVVIEEKENEAETVHFNIAKITQLIEKYIRQYPHEWGWMHRRWKSRPDVKAD